ncbi:MAG: exodeoxyribonuclease VII large subunit [Sulfurovum sp.]
MSSVMMSVSSLNIKIKSLLEATFVQVSVEGEVSSLTYHSSGHLYFSIKDKDSSIKCVMWRSAVGRLKFQIKHGMRIVIHGSIGVYTPRGEYQFYATNIEPYGKGALALAYEQLKESLKSKGYFDEANKKPIPKYINTIALVTAKESAGLYDMLKIIEKRWALVEVTIVDTLVQGDNAPSQIVHGLKLADSLGVDVVIVGRGGGSSEDLWSFNTQIVAEAIFAMNTPIVSAVGHEVDVLISDFVADLRAPTPSASIEMIFPDSQEILYTLESSKQRFKELINKKIGTLSRELKYTKESLLNSSPSLQLLQTQERFNRVRDELKIAISYKIESKSQKIKPIDEFNRAIAYKIETKRQQLKSIKERLLLSNPKLQCQKGWAKVSIDGKSVELKDIDIEQKFVLEDEFDKIEVVRLSR